MDTSSINIRDARFRVLKDVSFLFVAALMLLVAFLIGKEHGRSVATNSATANYAVSTARYAACQQQVAALQTSNAQLLAQLRQHERPLVSPVPPMPPRPYTASPQLDMPNTLQDIEQRLHQRQERR